MGKKNFTDFKYCLINSTRPNYDEVEVTYKYGEKQIIRFILVKKQSGVNSIEYAKKIIQKDLERGKLAKHPLRSHKGLLATVITVTAGAAIACGGLLTYKYLTQEPGQQEVGVVDMIIEDIKALNENSSEDEILKARSEYDNLSEADKAKVPAEVVTKLKEQEEKIIADKTSAEGFDKFVTTKLSNPDTCSKADLDSVEEAESLLNTRTKTLVTSETYTRIATASSNFNKDKQTLDSITNIVMKLDDTSNLIEFEEHKALITKFETQHTDLIAPTTATKTIFTTKYNKCEAEYNFINGEEGFLNKIGALKAKEEASKTVTWNEIEPIVEDEGQALAIKRKELTQSISSAINDLNGVIGNYNADKAYLTAFKGYVVDKLDPNSCNEDQLTHADNLYKEVRDHVDRQDILDEANSIKNGKLQDCRKAYNDAVEYFRNKAQMVVDNLNPNTCSEDEIERAIESIQDLQVEAAQKRGSDAVIQVIFVDALNDIYDILDLYNEGIQPILEYCELVKELDESTDYISQDPEELTLDKVQKIKEVTVTPILEARPTDLKLKKLVEEADRLVEVQTNKYETEDASLYPYEEAVRELDEYTSELDQIQDAQDLREGVIISKRPSLINRLRDIDYDLSVVKDCFDQDTQDVDALVNDVDNFPVETCSLADLDDIGSRWDVLDQSVVRESLRLQIQNCEEDITNFYTQYEADVEIATNFNESVDALTDASTDEDISEVEGMLEEARRVAKHPDLAEGEDSDGVTAHIEKLEQLRASYVNFKTAVDTFIVDVEKLEKAIYTCSDTDIKFCENYVQILELVTQEDLKAKVDEYAAKITPIRAKYSEDKTNAQAFNAAVQGIAQEPFPADKDIRELELQVADMKIIALHTDLKSGVDADIQKVVDMRSAYNRDEVNAKEVIDLIDALYTKTGASVITLSDITAITTAYNALTNDRAKGIADNLCKLGYGLDVASEVALLTEKHNIGKTFETAYNIASLPSEAAEYNTNAKKYHFLSIVRDYDSLDDISKHSLSEESQQKLNNIPASFNIEYACDTLINTGDEGLESISHSFDSTYGYMAKASIKNDIDPTDIHVSALKLNATEIASLKEKYSKVHFVVRISNITLAAGEQINIQFDETEAGTSSFQRVFITEDNVGQYIDVTLNINSQDFPETLAVIIEKASGDKFAGLTFEISSFYGEPIA